MQKPLEINGSNTHGELPNQILCSQINVKNQHEESTSTWPNQHRRLSGMLGMVGRLSEALNLILPGRDGRDGMVSVIRTEVS